jgi:hypothetical protein
MTRQFCDCCRNEFKDKEEYGILQMSTNLYNGITKDEIVVYHKQPSDDEDTNPFNRMFGRAQVEVTQLDICIECLRKLIALREHINLLYKQGHFNG